LRERGGWPVNGKKLPLNLLCVCLPGSRKLLRSRPGSPRATAFGYGKFIPLPAVPRQSGPLFVR
jgi:hypothetical protein